MREIKIDQSVTINRCIEDVFAYVSSIENLTDWGSGVIAVRKASSGCLHTGDVVRMTLRFLGRWMEMTYEVVEYQPPRLITLKGISGIAPCVFSWHFTVSEDGRTSVFQEAMLDARNRERFAGIAKTTMVKVARRQLQHDLLTLRDLLENSSSEVHN